MSSKTRLFIGIAGALLTAGFFLPWLDVGGGGFRLSATGLDMIRAGDFSFVYVMVLLVPILGVAMGIGALANWRHTRLLSVGTGLGFAAYASYKIVQAFFATTGWGLWLVIVGAIFALAAPLLQPSRAR